jgi:16S rRNA (guanine527-N7)-methyltransferase
MRAELRGSAGFLAKFNVSRETIERLECYHALLEKWNAHINLVSAASLSECWVRHFEDSAQLLALAGPHRQSWLDLGSGAGFPGLVIAILAPDLRVTLVESDARKAVFLPEVARACDVDCCVLAARIDGIARQNSDVISARALAPLGDLLGYAERHRSGCGICLFPKGESVHKDIAKAQKSWSFDCVLHLSLTGKDAVIVEIGDFKRV